MADRLPIDVEVDGHAVTIVERCAPWTDGMEWTTTPERPGAAGAVVSGSRTPS